MASQSEPSTNNGANTTGQNKKTTSTSETGHAKNLANIDKVIDLVTQFGAPFNPTNPQIQLSGLLTLKSDCKTAYDDHLNKFTLYKSATNAREIAFEPISKLATQISDNVKAINVPQQTIDDVVSIVTKIHGSASKLPKPSANKTGIPSGTVVVGDPTPQVIPTTISTSQQSYDSLLANFDKLVLQVQGIPTYSPNEANIQVSTIQTLQTTLAAINLTAITAVNSVNLARNQRNMVFYGTSTGLCDIMKKVKIYTRQIFGSTSPQYHQLTAITFKKIVQKKKAAAKKSN